MTMKSVLLPLAALSALAACSTTNSGVDVTRFHLEQPVARGSVFLEPANPDRAGSLEFRTYADAVAAELRDIGFTVASTRDAAELIGTMDYMQATRQAIAERSPVSVGIGGGTFGSGLGVGLGTMFGLGGGKSGDIVTNMLELRLKRESDETTIWEGRATSEAREGDAQASLSADIRVLADRLLRDYPGQSGETVTYED